MSEVIWEPGSPEGAVPTESQITPPDLESIFGAALLGAADSESAEAAQPVSRREARERMRAQDAAASTTSRVHSRRAARPQARRARPTTSERAYAFPALARKPRLGGRAMLAKLMSVSAMVGVAGMLVATSVPANAFFGEQAPESAQLQTSALAPVDVQSVGIDAASALTAKASARDSYTVVSLSEQLREQYGNVTFTFTNNPNGTIQWPFATSVPISSGFGHRAACSYCSSNHLGVDFVPGLGAPIQAIADGVVREVNVNGGAHGVNILIDHEINGEKVTSLYAHMMWGSPAVAAGQTVTVGQYIGDVGSTGASTGPHLHFEIHIDEKAIDPFVWLKANAN